MLVLGTRADASENSRSGKDCIFVRLSEGMEETALQIGTCIGLTFVPI